MAMMAEKKDKVQEILETVKTTQAINTHDVKEMVRLQDLFNVSALQVQQVMGQLDREGKRRLLWIVTTAAGYDTFEFWLQHGVYTPWGEEIYKSLERDFCDAYDERFQEVADEHMKVLNRQRELDKQEAELHSREADLRYREGLATLRAEKQAGEKVRALRQQVERLQKELETERALNRKAKRLARLVEKL